MAIQFDFYVTPDPTGESEEKYHARTVTHKTVDTDEMASLIQLSTTLTRADIKAVLTALSDQLAYNLGQSNRVHLEGIGYFQATVKYVREIDPDKTRAQSIWFKSVAFRADSELKKQLKNVVTERAIFKRHSEKISNGDIDKLVADYLAAGNVLTRLKLQELCGLTATTAYRQIKRLVEEGKIKNINTRKQPVYTASPQPSPEERG